MRGVIQILCADDKGVWYTVVTMGHMYGAPNRAFRTVFVPDWVLTLEPGTQLKCQIVMSVDGFPYVSLIERPNEEVTDG